MNTQMETLFPYYTLKKNPNKLQATFKEENVLNCSMHYVVIGKMYGLILPLQ